MLWFQFLEMLLLGTACAAAASAGFTALPAVTGTTSTLLEGFIKFSEHKGRCYDKADAHKNSLHHAPNLCEEVMKVVKEKKDKLSASK